MIKLSLPKKLLNAAAKEFFRRLEKPLRPIAGNHDYISTDDLESSHLAKLSEKQVAWLTSLLADNRNRPTIIYFGNNTRGQGII